MCKIGGNVLSCLISPGVVAWECGRYGWVGEPDNSSCKSPWLQDVIDEVCHSEFGLCEMLVDEVKEIHSCRHLLV